MNTVDLRPLFPPVRDQGLRGTCVAFAVTAAHELARHSIIGIYEDLSEETLYWNCKQIDGDQQEGTSFDSSAEALKHVGQPPEDKWAYDGFRDENDGSYTPPPDALDARFCFMSTLVNIPATIDAIKSRLAQGQAVVLGIATYDSFLMAAQGRVPLPVSHEVNTGGHAILVVGYEEDAVQGDWFIFRNSWGIGWGDNGHGYLPYDYLLQHGGEAWIIEP